MLFICSKNEYDFVIAPKNIIEILDSNFVL